jgi:anti-sigma B factor antagonist
MNFGKHLEGWTDMQHVVSIEGRITIDSSPEMRSKLAVALKSKPAELTVNLSEVTYIEMSGLATLVEAFRIARRQGTRLMVSGVQGQVRYLFEVTHLNQLFDIVPEQGVA